MFRKCFEIVSKMFRKCFENVSPILATHLPLSRISIKAICSHSFNQIQLSLPSCFCYVCCSLASGSAQADDLHTNPGIARTATKKSRLFSDWGAPPPRPPGPRPARPACTPRVRPAPGAWRPPAGPRPTAFFLDKSADFLLSFVYTTFRKWSKQIRVSSRF